jgi:hypothetical protein
MFFFMGIGPDKTKQSTLVWVIKRFLKNIKNHYEVVKNIQIPIPLADPAIVENIARLYRDNQWIINKKIFSQDKRPTKTVRANPKLIVMRIPNQNTVKALRVAGIPVEGILPGENSTWEKHPHGKALGNDYDVPFGDLLETLVKVHEQKRLILPSCDPCMANLLENLKRMEREKKENLKTFPEDLEGAEVLLALVLPIWFVEKIPYQRTYKA